MCIRDRFLPCCPTQRKFLMRKILTRSFHDNSCIFCLTVRTCHARVSTKVAKILWRVTYCNNFHSCFALNFIYWPGDINPSRDKNKLSAPSSFSQFGSCRVVIDLTDIEIATPGLMNQQNATYSNYRRMHSFKVTVGVAPIGVITYVSNLYSGSISDKAIVQQWGFLNHLTARDMVLGDKGFVIQDLVPNGVSVNIPPFLNNGSFTESEAKCRIIHVERANARLKDFKILNFFSFFTLSCRCHISTVCITC